MSAYSQNVSLEMLRKLEGLSVRPYNVCKNNGLTDLSKIIEYFDVNKSFIALNQCGEKADKELVSLCLKYKNEDRISELVAHPPSFRSLVEKLSARQKVVLGRWLRCSFSLLSNRTKNALSSYLNGDISLETFSKAGFGLWNFDPYELRHVGEKSAKEIAVFLEDFRKKASVVSGIEDPFELEKNFFSILTSENFKLGTGFHLKVFGGGEKDRIPVFKTVDLLLEESIIYKEAERYVFKHGLDLFTGNIWLPMQEIAKRLGLSTERIRQMKNVLLDRLPEKLGFLKELDSRYVALYDIDPDQPLVKLEAGFAELVNKNEGTCFNHFFLGIILASLLEEQFELIGNVQKKVLGKPGAGHKWVNVYLVERSLSRRFNFTAFIEDVERRLNERIEKGYSLSFKSYLVRFLESSGGKECSSEIEKLCEELLFDEFGVTINFNHELVFSRNTKKLLTEYVHEILEEASRPLHIKEIYEALENKQKGLSKNAEALKGTCQRDDRLMCISRTSTYALKKWEKSHKGLKGGTIRDIVADFLQGCDTPKHIHEVARHVVQYRNTTAANILSNLKLAADNRFYILNKSFIGLQAKRMSPAYKLNRAIPRFLGRTIMHYLRKDTSRRLYSEVVLKYQHEQGLNPEDVSLVIEHLLKEEYLTEVDQELIPNNRS